MSDHSRRWLDAMRALQHLERAVRARDAHGVIRQLDELRECGVSIIDADGRPGIDAPRVRLVLLAVVRLLRAESAVERASEARRLLPGGASRAKVTTANARWSTKCEGRDRVLAELLELGVDMHARSAVVSPLRAHAVHAPTVRRARAAGEARR